MKYIILLGDGMADFPIQELGNKTPLQHCFNPNMNYLAREGKVGKLQTIYKDLPVGSIVANMALLGYDPYKHYPNGRASFEALAQGISLRENDIAFRCNLISIDESENIKDFTSGNISDSHAKNLITNLSHTNSNIEVFSGQSYRNLLIYKNAGIDPAELSTFEPHCNHGTNIHDILPKGKSEKAQKIASEISDFMLESIGSIKKANEYFNTNADMIWLWSPSSNPCLPNFKDKYGKTGAIVAAMDFLKGIGVSGQMEFKDIPGANGYIDTNYDGKLAAAKELITTNDFVYIHLNGPDEEGHNKDIAKKCEAIENIDHKILGPLILFMKENYGDEFRIAVLPDHITALRDGHHYTDFVPYLMYGKGIQADHFDRYDEFIGDDTKADVSLEFLNQLFSD